MTESLESVRRGTDRTAAELALKRLAKELESVDNEFRSLRVKRNRDQETNNKLFLWLWLGGMIVCMIIGSPGGAMPYFAFVLAILATGGAIYLWAKQKSMIIERYANFEREASSRGDVIQRKINENRMLVD